MEKILPKIFDAHVHFRSAIEIMTMVVRLAARICADALIMPNLKPLPDFPGPITTGEEAQLYSQRILTVLRGHQRGTFRPRMTIQIRADTTPAMIREAGNLGVVAGKIYPAGVTTNSETGVVDYAKLFPVFEKMQEIGMVLSLHGEVPNPEVCPMDREREFLRILKLIADTFPDLKIVLEHISTSDAVSAVKSLSQKVVATITPQHMAFNSVNLMGHGTFNPHLFCMPVLKARTHMLAVREFATSGSSKAIFGSDSAPHVRTTKEAPLCCAGCFSTPVMIPIVAQIFEEMGAWDLLPEFLGDRGRAFYGLDQPNDPHDMIRIIENPWNLHASYVCPPIVPLCAEETMKFQVISA